MKGRAVLRRRVPHELRGDADEPAPRAVHRHGARQGAGGAARAAVLADPAFPGPGLPGRPAAGACAAGTAARVLSSCGPPRCRGSGARGRRGFFVVRARPASNMPDPTPEILPVDPLAPDPGAVRRAAKLLAAGGIVAYPTDTLYGLAVDPRRADAVERLFRAKGPARRHGGAADRRRPGAGRARRRRADAARARAGPSVSGPARSRSWVAALGCVEPAPAGRRRERRRARARPRRGARAGRGPGPSRDGDERQPLRRAPPPRPPPQQPKPSPPTSPASSTRVRRKSRHRRR